MRLIEIRSRLRPFSHRPGTVCLVPGTSLCVQAFPTLIRVGDQEVELPSKGVPKQFTVVQDLERFCVTIFNESATRHVLPSGEVVVGKHPRTETYDGPRYAFGMHKKLHWEEVKRRSDLRELFPIWHRLGVLADPPVTQHDGRGTFQLLERCERAIVSHRPETIAPAFEALFHAGMGDLMVPRTDDTDFQGYLPRGGEPSRSNPLLLLKMGAELIRSLFIVESDRLALLPNLPPELAAGRILGERCSLGKLGLQWQSKRLRMVVLDVEHPGELLLDLPRDIRRFRLKKVREQRGTSVDCGTPLAFDTQGRYVLDRFER